MYGKYLKLALAFLCVANIVSSPLFGGLHHRTAKPWVLRQENCRKHCGWGPNKACVKKCLNNHCDKKCRYYDVACYDKCIKSKK